MLYSCQNGRVFFDGKSAQTLFVWTYTKVHNIFIKCNDKKDDLDIFSKLNDKIGS